MPPIRDAMSAFELFQPASVGDALGLLDRHGADAWVMAGGMDTFDWLKDRIRKPKVVVDLGMVDELRGIKDAGGGIEIGATTTLTTVANNPLVKERFPLLAQAALIVASPQIRNQGTVGGNVSQDARCWYYRAGWPCYRAGGNICYADTPTSVNREHALFNADRCVAVNPSDTAPALIALDAEFVIKRGSAERVVPAREGTWHSPHTKCSYKSLVCATKRPPHLVHGAVWSMRASENFTSRHARVIESTRGNLCAARCSI